MLYIEGGWDRFGGTISLAYARETIWGSGVGLIITSGVLMGMDLLLYFSGIHGYMGDPLKDRLRRLFELTDT